MTTRKKLIEVALPLDAINQASAYEKMPGIGAHPRGLHLWWARRPLAAARAVIFAQMVDDPSSQPDLFPTEHTQDQERQRLFDLIKDLVKWENTNDEALLRAARREIRENWRRTCADNAGDPRARDLFDRERLPAFHDPFAGGGALPLEAQRLGLEPHASDLNPVAVLINKAMIEIPPKFAECSAVNPALRSDLTPFAGDWTGARGLAEDVRYYGRWMRDQAHRRIGHLYPKITVTDEMARERPDLKPYAGQALSVIAWLWARTVKSPNPATANMEVPLISTYILASKRGKEAYVEPVIEAEGYRFSVKVGTPPHSARDGTKLSRGANFRCLISGAPIAPDYIKEEGVAGRIGARLMAIVAEGASGRIYLSPTLEHESAAHGMQSQWRPDLEFFQQALGFRVGAYGMTRWSDLFTSRQLVALNTLSDLIAEVVERIRGDAIAANVPEDGQPLHAGGTGATAYAHAVAVYLALAVDRCADFSNTCTRWVPGNQKTMNLFGKQAIAMTWDYPEAAILHDTVGGFVPASRFVAECILKLPRLPWQVTGHATQHDAASKGSVDIVIISTDPPYYDNIGYSDLSDFFYVWLRRSLKSILPDLFSTMAVPKAEELVATPGRHGTKAQAESFFVNGMTRALHLLGKNSHPAFPVTVYYAFKQTETKSGTARRQRTGWETFLDALIRSGFAVTGTWPMRSEQQYRMRGIGSNALASSIVLVCRRRSADAPITTRRDLITCLKAELPSALVYLQRGNIAPVDLAQAAIGPGMAVYTRYEKVLDATGSRVSVGEALALINQTLDETLAEQEGDFDADSRWALAWFEQYGFDEGDYGIAETLSTAKNTSVAGMVEAGILHSRGGKVRLLRPKELPADWDPARDDRLITWEIVHHLIRVLEQSGEGSAAQLVRKLGGWAEIARELCYRLYTVCERKKRASDALAYNGLVQSWPEISRLARMEAPPEQAELFASEGTEGTR